MAVTHSTAARNAGANAKLALLNGGSANAAGIFRFRTSANAVVAGLALSNPAFGNASNGQAAANAITADTNAAGGVISRATLEDRDRNAVITLDDIRTTAGGDMQGNNLTVGAGDTVQVLSLTYVETQ
jgi:hypothetical protein